MKAIFNKKNLIIFSLVVFFLLLMKIDYRTGDFGKFNPTDDAGYMYHAYTVGLDFDLDYSNQIINPDKSPNPGFYLNGDTYVPKHPIGTGILAAPFVFIGSLVEKVNTKFIFSTRDQIYFFYSLSSIFYFFVSLLLLTRIINNSPHFKKTNPLIIFYLLLGSGIVYYSFERFSMTHTYEIFSVSLLFFISFRNKDANISLLNYLLGLLGILFLTIRWVNIFLILIPILYYLLIESKKSIGTLFKSKSYYLGLLTGIIVFLFHSKVLYGVYTINPKFVYRNNSSLGFLEYAGIDSYFNIDALILAFKSLGIILFSREFGLLYFSPILFFSALLIIKLIIKKQYVIFATLIPIYGIPVAIVVLWQATGSAYGYRYLSCLIPISIILIFRFLDEKFYKYLYLVNFLSVFLFLKFETNQMTSLSQEVNSFGRLHNYSGKNYIQGVSEGLFQINTYLVVIMTSFLAVICFKLVISLFGLQTIENLIEEYGYMNGDVVNFLELTVSFSYIEVLIIVSFFYYFSSKLLSKSKI